MRGKPRGYNKKKRTRRIIKRGKRKITLPTIEQKIVKAKIKETNKRIDLITKKFGKEKWAVKGLLKDLSVKPLNMISKGKVKRISTRIDKLKLMAINKALDNFLKKKTSTIKGIRDAIKKTKQTIKEQNIEFDEENDIDIDNYDVETMYDLMAENDFRWLAEKTEQQSELMAMIQTARYEDWSVKKWIEEVKENFIYFNDVDTRERVVRLYNNLVVNKRNYY